MDNSQSFVTEQSDIEDEKPIISRTRSISENMDDYFEKVNTESKLEINNILDSESEFLVSDDWKMRIIYIYMFSDNANENILNSRAELIGEGIKLTCINLEGLQGVLSCFIYKGS